MARNRNSRSRRGGLGAAILVGLTLGACATPPKPREPTEADLRPMVAPEAPPSSPDFNVRVAKPLPNPEAPFMAPLPVPNAPPPLATFQPLPNPETPALAALPAAPVMAAPSQRAQPISRPAEPARDTVTALTPKPAQTASAPAAAASAGAPVASYRLVFPVGADQLPDTAAALVATLADSLVRDEHLRLKLSSYASGSTDDPVAARRLSLQRALKFRSALVDKGIASTRVDVMALGLGDGGSPADRIDILPVN